MSSKTSTKRVPGITEKRLNNKRFRRTEDKILQVFFEDDDDINASTMSKKIGVARSTFHYHHRAIRDIIPDYRKYILQKYRRQIRKLLRIESIHMKTLYFNTLLFIFHHQRAFKILTKNEDKRIIEDIVSELTPKLERIMNLPKNSDKILAVYKSEVVALIWLWIKGDYTEEKINETVISIMDLTRSARVRLKELLR